MRTDRATMTLPSEPIKATLPRDLTAGLVVFLVALPLCLGVALASNAPLFSGVLAGIVGTIQATEALKLILGLGRPLTDRLLDFDARRTQFREIRIKRNPDCPLCGEHPTITELFEDGNVGPSCALPGQQ